MPLPGVLRVVSDFHWSVQGFGQLYPQRIAQSHLLMIEGGSETLLEERRLLDSPDLLFSFLQMSPGLPAQAQHKGRVGGPP